MTDPIAYLQTQALAAAAAPVLAALTAIQASPTALNVAAQGVALQGQLLAVLPALETDAIAAFAAQLHDQITKAIAPAPVVTPPPAPKVPANAA